jgi:uncharacterized membrane protein YdbT with pleckstrin-like domain
MSYVGKTRGANEQTRYRTGYHCLYWLGAYALAAPAFAIALGGYPYDILDYVLGAGALLALPFGLIMLVRAYAAEFVVTSERFVVKRGLVSYAADEICLDTIEEVDIDESILGRLLGFGTLEVNGAGNAKIAVNFISRPDRLRREIQDARMQATPVPSFHSLAVAA